MPKISQEVSDSPNTNIIESESPLGDDLTRRGDDHRQMVSR